MKNTQQAEVFPWNIHFSTGLPEVDAQHRQLVQLLNRLACHLVYGSDAPTAQAALDELADYVSYHFRTEEAVWSEHLPGDPLVLEHRRIHEGFTAHIGSLLERTTEHPEALFQDLLVFLTRWLANHILQDDRHLAAIVRGLQDGLPPGDAKARAGREIDGTAAVLADTIVALYDQFSRNSATMIHEIDLRRRANEELLESRTQLDAIIDSTFDLVWSVDADHFGLKVFNRAAADYILQGYGIPLAPGMTPDSIYPDASLTGYWSDFYKRTLQDGAFTTEYKTLSGARHLRLNFTPLQRNGKVFGVAVFGKDITEHKAAEASIHRLAFYDPLTDLPNRRLFQDRLLLAIAGSRRSRNHSALLVCDLDNLKLLNDARGHAAGDQVIVETAKRLSAIVRSDDTVARQHSDEFVVILNDVGASREEAMRECGTIGRRILESVGQAFHLGAEDYLTTMSIGACLFHGGQPSPDALFQNADTAMHEAKAVGRNTLRFFDPAMKASLESRVSLEAAMRAGFPAQFLLHYQPQLDQAGRVIGAEALVRWQHPVRGLVPPGTFIPIAERIGLILDLGTWVLRAACARLASLRASAGNRDLHLSVNVSAMQFAQPDFVDTVLAALEASGADPHALQLELTESMLVFNVEDVIGKMSSLKSLGVTFSLDDFGTGYSSLSSLKRLPLDQLKIDQSFVRDIQTDPNDAAIARTIIALGRSLGLAVIAEGVETQEQRDFLAAQGCNLYQGYFFSRPLPPDQFEAFLERTARP